MCCDAGRRTPRRPSAGVELADGVIEAAQGRRALISKRLLEVPCVCVCVCVREREREREIERSHSCTCASVCESERHRERERERERERARARARARESERKRERERERGGKGEGGGGWNPVVDLRHQSCRPAVCSCDDHTQWGGKRGRFSWNELGVVTKQLRRGECSSDTLALSLVVRMNTQTVVGNL